MSIEQSLAPRHVSSGLPILTAQAITDFGKWLEGFYVERQVTLPFPEKIRVLDIPAALFAYGATSKTGAVIVNPTQLDSYGGMESYERPTKWDHFYHRYDAWIKTQSRTEYAEKKTLEALDKVAESMNLGPQPEDENPNPPVKRGYVLRRSGLNAYMKRHGHEYAVPEGATIIEDENEEREVAVVVPETDDITNDIVDNF